MWFFSSDLPLRAMRDTYPLKITNEQSMGGGLMEDYTIVISYLNSYWQEKLI
jgi:hypothetical protein